MKMNTAIISAAGVLMLCGQTNAFSQAIQVKQVKDSLYKVEGKSVRKEKLVWSNTPDSWSKAKTVSLTSSDEAVFASAHPIIRTKTASGKFWYEAPRLIQLKGAINFRDLGGYATKDNREVKWGKIYRSADISKLTDEDMTKLAELNIKIICDLRGPAEVAAAPDRVPAGAEDINLPAGSETTGTAGSFMKYLKTPERADSLLRSVYVRNDFYKAKYKPMFDALLKLEDDKSVLFHCTAGKDRTGIGAALILYALGVDENTILKDYEATNEYRKAGNEAMVQGLVKQGVSEAAARSLMAADPKYLKACFESLAKNYGSVDNFLVTEIGLTPENSKLLKSKFLY